MNDNGHTGNTATPDSPAARDAQWQQDLINRLAFASLSEQRKQRRWNIFFKAMFLAYLILVLVLVYLPVGRGTAPVAAGRHTALIDVRGVIADSTPASADNIVTALRRAFDNTNTAGVILRINSPGGSPVQAGYINDEIHRLRKLHPKIPVYAVITDICASGGYFIAAASDKIYANKASLVGSIGVIMNGFGFVDSMKKLGVERRLFTAGDHKGFLDPFSPLKPDEVAHVRAMLDNIHQQFIDVVKQGRGDRIKDDKRLFSGLIWTGEEAKPLGLIDGFGSASYVARDVIGAEKIVNYTVKPGFFDRLSDRLGTTMANTLAARLGFDGPRIQ